MKVEFNNLTEYSFNLKRLRELLKKPAPKAGNLSIAFLKEDEMEKVNKEYREKEGATDVLSFRGEGDFLGEILLCPSYIEKEAKKRSLSFEKETQRALVHGLLHLLGYDHLREDQKKKMKEKEEEILSS